MVGMKRWELSGCGGEGKEEGMKMDGEGKMEGKR